VNARALWEPWMAREYHIAPRDLRGYTSREINALRRDFKASQEVLDG